MTERDGECRVWGAEPVPAVVTDYAWPAGLGSLEIALAESSLFSPFFHVCLYNPQNLKFPPHRASSLKLRAAPALDNAPYARVKQTDCTPSTWTGPLTTAVQEGWLF